MPDQQNESAAKGHRAMAIVVVLGHIVAAILAVAIILLTVPLHETLKLVNETGAAFYISLSLMLAGTAVGAVLGVMHLRRSVPLWAQFFFLASWVFSFAPLMLVSSSQEK